MKHTFLPGLKGASLISVMVLGSLVPAMADYDYPLTENEVQYYMKTYERTFNRQNPCQIAKMLSPDAEVRISVDNKTFEMNRGGYTRLLQSKFQDLSKYRYVSNVKSVTINGNKATVWVTAYEKIEGPEGPAAKVHEAMAVVEKRMKNNKAYLVTTLVADTVKASAPPEPKKDPNDPNNIGNPPAT